MYIVGKLEVKHHFWDKFWEDFSLEWGQTQKYKNTKTQTNNHRQIPGRNFPAVGVPP